MQIKVIFILRLLLKQKHMRTRKWPILLTFFLQFVVHLVSSSILLPIQTKNLSDTCQYASTLSWRSGKSLFNSLPPPRRPLAEQCLNRGSTLDESTSTWHCGWGGGDFCPRVFFIIVKLALFWVHGLFRGVESRYCITPLVLHINFSFSLLRTRSERRVC